VHVHSSKTSTCHPDRQPTLFENCGPSVIGKPPRECLRSHDVAENVFDSVTTYRRPLMAVNAFD
jgi:hypothetical protein